MSNLPLDGATVIELGGIGPLPHFGMMCVDLGARVIRVERPTVGYEQVADRRGWLFHGRESIAIDLKCSAGVELVLSMVERADVMVEANRPGVLERLGLGPTVCLQRNPRLVLGRLSSWGASGPMSQRAAHDINVVAMSGALHTMGPSGGPPSVPLSLVGDYGGGSMLLLSSVLAALLRQQRTNSGCVLDVAMSDGVIGLMCSRFADLALGGWDRPRGENTVDGGAPFYNVYKTSDGRFMAVGAVEAKFYARLIAAIDADPALRATQWQKNTWPATRAEFAAIFASRTQAEWINRIADIDACITPALTMDEASCHPHHLARGAFGDVDGHVQTMSPFPFGTEQPADAARVPQAGSDRDIVLRWAGLSETAINDLVRNGIVE
jgi:alpha-methylacyl-CoA racemase